MGIEGQDFLKEKEKIEKMPDAERKSYYKRWLENHREKSTAYISAALNYARILYGEGSFRKAMGFLMW